MIRARSRHRRLSASNRTRLATANHQESLVAAPSLRSFMRRDEPGAVTGQRRPVFSLGRQQRSGCGPSRLRSCLTDSLNYGACGSMLVSRTAMDPVLEWTSITGVRHKFQPNTHRASLVKRNGELEILLLSVARTNRRAKRSAGAD